MRVGLKPRLSKAPRAWIVSENKKVFRYFDFDVLLANPPFAGDIKDLASPAAVRTGPQVQSRRRGEADDDPDALAEYQSDPQRHAFRAGD